MRIVAYPQMVREGDAMTPEQIKNLTEKINQVTVTLAPQYPAGVPDWAIADLLNAPDDTQAPIVTLERTLISEADVILALGADVGVARLAAFDQAAATNPTIARVMALLYKGQIDVGTTLARTLLDSFVTAGLLSSSEASAIKNLAQTSRYPSWAEANNATLDAQIVGRLRGAI